MKESNIDFAMDLTISFLSSSYFFETTHTVIYFHKANFPGGHQVSLLQGALDPPVASKRHNFPPFAVLKLKLNWHYSAGTVLSLLIREEVRL